GPYIYTPQILANLIGVQRTQNGMQVALNANGVRDLLARIKQQIDRTPKAAKFIFNDDTRQLDLLEDSKVGRTLDMDASIKAINDALFRGEHTIPLSVT